MKGGFGPPRSRSRGKGIVQDFFDAIFLHAPNGAKFYGCTVHKKLQKGFPKFYSEPGELIAAIKAHGETDERDFYFSPAFYRRQTKAIKSNVSGAGCVWIDCDSGAMPKFETEPNFVLETSPNHYHCYWLLDGMRPPDEIEAINRRLAYGYNEDKSGWDVTQLLRPPGSYNRKRNNFRTRIDRHDLDTRASFTVDATDIEPARTAAIGGSVEALFAELVFTKSVRDLIFTKELSANGEGRSGVIFQTACELVRMRLKDAEILVLLKYQDARLNKFVNRQDQTSALQGVIESARKKSNLSEPKESVTERPLYKVYRGNTEFFLDQSEDSYLWKDFLFEDGILVIGGEPGSGKSRLALDLIDHLATGRAFLEREVYGKYKCAYLGLDMPPRRVRGIRQQQSQHLTDGEKALIEENVTLFLRGSGLMLSDIATQERVKMDLLEINAKVVCIDVIGRAVRSLNDDVEAQVFLDWIQGMVNDYGMSFILISHTRKAQPGNKSAMKQDDFFGSRYWSIANDSSFLIEDSGQHRYVLHITKDRSGELPQEIFLEKDYTHSLFTLAKEGTVPMNIDVKMPGGKLGGSL